MQAVHKKAIEQLNTLATEQRNPASIGISDMPSIRILKIINDLDTQVTYKVREALPSINRAVELLVSRMELGGRLVYVGAGTSGRLGYMDAAECRPTYGCEEDTVSCVMAGGKEAVFHPQEELEDRKDMAEEDLIQFGLTSQDVVVAASASGRTPYCIGALDYAQSIGAGTVSLACNLQSEMSRHAQVSIEVDTGAEVILGSTRMKAGTAQKIVMNMLSTSVMIRLGRTCDNLMVMINASNIKANHRVLRLFAEAVGNTDMKYAEKMLELAQGDLSVAVLMSLCNVDVEQAKLALQEKNNNFSKAEKFLKSKVNNAF